MKQCPFCAEAIQDAAVKCRFCHEFLPDAVRPDHEVLQRSSFPIVESFKRAVSTRADPRILWQCLGVTIVVSTVGIAISFLIDQIRLSRSAMFLAQQSSLTREEAIDMLQIGREPAILLSPIDHVVFIPISFAASYIALCVAAEYREWRGQISQEVQ